MLDKLMEGHAKIADLIAELETLLASPTPADPGQLGKLRWAMTREVMEHLYMEERCTFDRLARSANPWVRQRGAEFKETLSPIHAEYMAHMRRWQGAVADAEWKDYAVAARQLLHRLKRRMLDEETRLYPMLQAEEGLLAKAS